ncbi:MAG: DUF3617 family protein [Burkholderiales bacterium]|nr:DUF3617 family protein [Burkholderiales bacterium]
MTGPIPPRFTVLSAVALAALAFGAAAQDYPKLKAGQWEITVDRGPAAKGPTSMRNTMCTDDAVQRDMIANGMGMSRELCTRNEFHRDGARYVGAAQCQLGESAMHSRSVMTLTGDTAYRIDIVASFEPPMMGMKESRTTIAGKYVGPCRDGLVPGDIIGPNGQKANIRNLGTGAPPLRQPALPPTATPKKATP